MEWLLPFAVGVLAGVVVGFVGAVFIARREEPKWFGLNEPEDFSDWQDGGDK